MRKITLFAILFGLIGLGYWGYSYQAKLQNDLRATVVKVSSDGEFAVVSTLDGHLFYYDLLAHQKKKIATGVNDFAVGVSADNQHFLWQDMERNVHLVRKDGFEVETFQIPLLIHSAWVSKNLEYFIFATEKRGLYAYKAGEWIELKTAERVGTLGMMKQLEVHVDDAEQYLFTMASGGVKREEFSVDHPDSTFLAPTVWTLNSGKPLFKVLGHDYKTTGAISPDGHYVVSGCENAHAFVWDVFEQKQVNELESMERGRYIRSNIPGELGTYDDSNVNPPPKGAVMRRQIPALKFIDNDHFLRFGYESDHVALYHVLDAVPTKYLNLGHNPLPSVDNYLRSQSIDTAPKVHRLVTGKAHKGGILVYDYDPETQTLTKVWDAR